MAFKCQRWTLANILPVAFVTWVICTIWLLYSWLHLHPLLQIGWPAAERDEDAYHRGLVQTIFSQTVTALLLICFGRAVCTDPGTVPETAKWAADGIDPKLKWSSSGQAETDRLIPEVHEVKQSGARRFCKWCNSYKPDRCHHCRVCKSCILRMDHHCPWIANCVGFRNHKYFFLLVFYALINCGFISVTISESLFRSLEYHTTSLHRFLLVFGMTLSVIMGFLLAMFFMLHVWLMLQATTTIEFCEKKTKHLGKDSAGTTTSFDHGLYRNIQAVLGPMPIFWLLPIMPPSGQGLSFDVRNETTSAKDQSSETPEIGVNETSALLAAHRKEQSLCQQNEDIISTEPEKVSAGLRDTTCGGKEVISDHAAKSQAASFGDAIPPEVTGRGAATV